MDIATDQLHNSTAVLATVAAIIVAVAILGAFAVFLVKRTWRWVTGGGKRVPKVAETSPGTPEPLPSSSGHAVTSADLLVVKSNMLMVMRQIEDLERRVRLGQPPQAKVVELRRVH